MYLLSNTWLASLVPCPFAPPLRHIGAHQHYYFPKGVTTARS